MRRTRLLGIIAALAAALPAAGCGGGGAPSSSSSSTTTGPAATTGSTSGSSAPSTSAAASHGSESLSLTGTVSGPLQQVGSVACVRITDQGPPEFDLSANGNVGGKEYDLSVVIHDQAGAGAFQITQLGNKVEFSTHDGLTIWDGYAGTVTVDSGNQSGSMNVKLSSGGSPEQPNLPITMGGTFTCGT